MAAPLNPGVSEIKKNPRGKYIDCRQREKIINLYKSKVKELSKHPTQQHTSFKDLIKLMSQEIGIGQRTITTTIGEYRRNGTVSSPTRTKVRMRFSDKVECVDKTAIRHKIYEFWHRKEIPTSDKVLKSINDDPSMPNFARSSFNLLLKDLNYEFTKIKQNSALTERSDIVCLRQKYLESIRYYRNCGRQIYYVDETWINLKKTSKSWVVTTVQSGQKNRLAEVKGLIAVHIGSSDGFCPGRLLALESKKNYSDEMDRDTFYNWFITNLSTLEDNSVIVMDDALCHSEKKNMFPLISWKKKKIIEWLEKNGKIIDRPMVKHRLLEEAEEFRSVCDKYVIDELAKENNKIVLRLPPLHNELNPIELAWSSVKHYININNTTSKLSDVLRLLNEGVEQITPLMWKNYIEDVIKVENKLFDIDFIVDELLEAELTTHKNVLTLVSSDTSDSEFDD